MRTAVITIVAGRHEHLARQRAALDPAVEHVIVAMGDDAVEGASLRVPSTPLGLPLAHARNAGARHALDQGAELLVFLDVDCIPGPRLLERYAAAAAATDGALLCGPVGYLPPGEYAAEHARPHPARPVPRDDEIVGGGDHTLFWTLSFALTRATWEDVGEFCEDYVGYGGEDTDYGQLAKRAGVELRWVGGAWAYHQHHETQSPPVQHLEAILRNAAVFERRWGWRPMQGWLQAFEERGLVRLD